ncbi:DUF2336 domain-containing protein [Dongia sedimenti]|uniref:DUF2336 domain-containing protein n=1 Tax=Dongia sedimenti TaxID=3064282 RepID=A0ABU0YL04_9PROT|nr:DUF2336 domain-containing protein [Rhodospirillaceae bacterium R-7]
MTAIGDLMGDHGRILTLQERALVNDILKKLIQDVARPVRKALAEKLALSPHAPREVTTLLANDEFDIASPILLNSPLLEDEDLMEIVRHRTISHRLAIAMRRSLNEPVCDALVATNSVDVIKALLENHGARISAATMTYLVDQSKTLDVYQEPLLRRADLPQDLAKRMYCWVSAAMRQFIVENFPVDPVELDLALSQIAQQAAQSVSLPAADDPAINLARQLAERQDLTPDIIVETLRRGETPLFEAMLGERIGVKPILARKLIYDSTGEGLVVACRAAGIDRSSFVTLFMLMQRARTEPMTRDPYLMSKSLELFDRVSTDAAKKMVERWSVDPEYLKSILKLQQRRR